MNDIFYEAIARSSIQEVFGANFTPHKELIDESVFFIQDLDIISAQYNLRDMLERVRKDQIEE